MNKLTTAIAAEATFATAEETTTGHEVEGGTMNNGAMSGDGGMMLGDMKGMMAEMKPLMATCMNFMSAMSDGTLKPGQKG